MTGSVNVPAAMRAYNSFIVWKLVPYPGEAKPRKLPINPLTGEAASSMDPATWVPYDIACAVFFGGGFDGIGFVFSNNDPFFFLDLDGARTADNWQPYAFDIVKRFVGASTEISQSGSGLHIVGYCDKRQLATRRNVFRDAFAGKVEFYTTGRFMAVGFGNWSSEPAGDLTAALLAFVPERDEAGEAAIEAYTGPRQTYTGLADDDALIALMLDRGDKGAAAVFGGGPATVRQLWQGDSAALGAAYPDSHGSGRPFDYSAADAALLAHLAFWTGADGERMERLFTRSALGQREKWTSRPDYRVRSTLSAIKRCKAIYDVVPTETKKAKAAAVPTSAAAASAPGADPFSGGGSADGAPVVGSMLTAQEQAEYFKGCISVVSLGRILTPKNQLLDSTRFNIEYGGKIFILSAGDAAKTTDEPWKAATRGQGFKVPSVQDLCFRPDLPPREIVVDDLNRRVVNSYMPVNVARTDGDVTPFLNHVAKMLPVESDREILLAYMAACVQYPGVKFQWCPIIQGIKGNGKTLLTTALSYAVGERYVHSVNAEELGGGGTKFNSWLFQKLLIVIEEIYVRGNYGLIESLKPLITNTRIEFQAKGQDQFTGDNRANFLMATNHKDAVPIEEDERRYSMFYTAQQSPEDMTRDGFIFPNGAPTAYMSSLYDWFNATNSFAGQEPGKHHVAGFLARYAIPADLNPAGALHRAPRTSAWTEARSRSASPAEEAVADAIADGVVGFRNGWLSGWALEKLFDEKKLKVSRRMYRDTLVKLGFVPHPQLLDGRAGSPIFQEDARKSRLYILKNHPSLSSSFPERDYMASQGYK